MKLSLALSLCALCVCVSGQAITDCSQLRLGTTGPLFPGNFPLCGDLGDQQCCTAEFLTNTAEGRAVVAFSSALQEEFADSRQEYQDFLNRLNGYFITSGQFVRGVAESFAISIPIVGSEALLLIESHISESFSTSLNIDDDSNFDIDNFVSGVLNELSQAFSNVISALPGIPTGIQQCIQGVLSQLTNIDVQALVDGSIKIVRQSYTVLVRIQKFLQGLATPDFTPVQSCIERFANLSYCGRCTQRIPPLCRGTCNNIVRGCLSPVYTAYRNGFNDMWQYTRNVITNLETSISELFSEEGLIINDITNLIATLQSDCFIDLTGFNPFSTLGKRQSDDEVLETVFRELFSELDDLNGFFEFDSDGPDFCEPESSEEIYCSNVNRDSTADRSCAVNSICVSECDCWDGTAMRATNTETFSGGSSVEDQALNPAVEGIQEELVAQAALLQNPASAFLASENVTSVNPEGVVIPRSGAVRVVISMATVVLAVVIGLMV